MSVSKKLYIVYLGEQDQATQRVHMFACWGDRYRYVCEMQGAFVPADLIERMLGHGYETVEVTSVVEARALAQHEGIEHV